MTIKSQTPMNIIEIWLMINVEQPGFTTSR